MLFVFVREKKSATLERNCTSVRECYKTIVISFFKITTISTVIDVGLRFHNPNMAYVRSFTDLVRFTTGTATGSTSMTIPRWWLRKVYKANRRLLTCCTFFYFITTCIFGDNHAKRNSCYKRQTDKSSYLGVRDACNIEHGIECVFHAQTQLGQGRHFYKCRHLLSISELIDAAIHKHNTFPTEGQ